MNWLNASLLQTPAGRTELTHLAYALRENQTDFWLSDFLKAPFSSSGTDLLISAIKANYSGDHQTALHDADLAVTQFRDAKNLAGAILGQYQAVYALRRQSHSGECLGLITRIGPLLGIRRYKWLQLQIMMEQSVCEAYAGHFDRAARLANIVVADAERANYPSLALRTLSLVASWHMAEGRFRQSWNKNEEGLGRFWNAEFPSERGFQLYSDLELTAEQTEEWHLAFVLQREVLALINETGRLDFQATAHLHLATTAAAIHDSREAQQEFSNAHDLFVKLPQTTTIRFLEADSEIGLVQQQISHGQIQSAHDRLIEIGKAISAATSFVVQLRYQKAWAALERQISNTAQEQMALQEVVRIGNEGYRSLKTEKERWEWAHEVGDSYRRLLELEVEQPHNREQAMADWELYHIQQTTGASRFPGKAIDNPFARKYLLTQARLLHDSTLVAFAVFPQWTTTWVLDDRGVRETRIPLSAKDLQRLVQDFYSLCSDPDSSLEKVKDEGLRLYRLLIGPISSEIEQNRSLLIETDDLLSLIPWSALVTEAGTYLGERYKLLQVPGLFYEQRRAIVITRATHALIAYPGAVTVDGHLYPPLPQGEEEAARMRKQYSNVTYLSQNEVTSDNLRTFLPTAAIFHFVGHAISDAYGGQLVVHGETGGELISSSALDSLDLHKAQLVVLSACSTAVTEGESTRDPNGLVRAFLRSGAQQVLASRWDVSSGSSSVLTTNFHSALISGLDVAEALRRSRSILMHAGSTSHPHHWASFELFGNIN
jgi:CHAT domain-containing protein